MTAGSREKDEEELEGPFPARLSFILNNFLRRRFDRSPRDIIKTLGINNTSVVMDFGCGPGFYAIPFAKVAKKVIAVDIQPKMLDKASKYAQKNGVTIECLQSNGKQIPLPDGSCDLIFLSTVYHEIKDKRSVLAELRRLLKPEGMIAIAEVTRWIPLGPPVMNTEEIKNEVEAAGFSTKEIISKKVRSIVVATPSADTQEIQNKSGINYDFNSASTATL